MPEHNNNGNGISRVMFLVVTTVLGTLSAAGIIGTVIMYGRLSSLETSHQALVSVVSSQNVWITKIVNDFYVPKVSAVGKRKLIPRLVLNHNNSKPIN